MKLTVKGLSSERLDQEIAKVYYDAHLAGVPVSKRAKQVLDVLWDEFDERVKEGRDSYERKPGYGVYGA